MEKQKGLTSHEAHKLFKNTLILALSDAGAYVWANESGAIKSVKGHFIKYGHNGSADILGVWRGRFVAVEAKTGTGKQSDQQKIFETNINKQEGIYHVAKWDGKGSVMEAALQEVAKVGDRVKGCICSCAGCCGEQSGHNCADACAKCQTVRQCMGGR